MVLVESIPQHVKYKANVTIGIPLEKVWKDLISMATDQVDVVSFYWTLTGEDINVNSSSDIPVSCQLKHKETLLNISLYLWRGPIILPFCPRQGREILKGLEELPSRNVSVRVVTSVPSVRTNSTDLKILKQKGLEVTPLALFSTFTAVCFDL